MNVLFIGGCLNRQKSLAPEKHYHQQFIRQCKPQGLSLNAAFGKYLSYSTLDKIVRQLIQKKQPEVLVLYLRPFPLMPLGKPLVKYDLPNGDTALALHPGVLKPGSLEWDDAFTRFQADEDYSFRKRSKFGWRDINLIAGGLLGLHKWALQFIEAKLNEIHNICRSVGIELVVMLPSRNPESMMGNYICKITAVHMEALCRKNNLPFVNTFSLPFNCFKEDRVHLNEHGHRLLAEMLCSAFKMVSAASSQKALFA